MNTNGMTFAYDAETKSTPPACDSEIFKDGHTVFLISDWKTDAIEDWCQSIAKQSGQRLDWHYVGGRANILALGNLDRVRDTIKRALPELNAQIRAHRISNYGSLKGFSYDTYSDEDVDHWKNRVVFRDTPTVRAQFDL